MRFPVSQAASAAWLLAACLCLDPGLARAQAPSVSVPRIDAPPQLEMFAGSMGSDGPSDTPMRRVEGFVNRFPKDGEKTSQRTVVYLGRDERALYVVVLCYSDRPDDLRAHLVRRDGLYDDDDSIAVQIDTFRDFRRAYGFQANFAGAKKDGFWIEGTGWNFDADFDFDVAGVTNEYGYAMRFTIPLRTLDYPADADSWGLLIFRGLPSTNEQAFWPGYSRKIQGRMNQAAKLENLRPLPPPARGTLVPYLTAGRTNVEGHRDHDAQVGLDARFRIGAYAEAGVTINPDFSQIESDEPQIATNQRFELFYAEKRPFFGDHARHFSTPLNLLFTRRIANPQYGIKAAGQGEDLTWGALAVEDEPIDADNRRLWAGRARYDVTADLSLAALATSLGNDDHRNDVAAVDGQWRLPKGWAVQSQLARSQDRGNDLRQSGTAGVLRVQGTSAAWTYDLLYQQISPDFSTDAGFVPRVGIRDVTQTTTWRHYPGNSAVLALGPDLILDYTSDENGLRLDRGAELAFVMELPHLTKLSVFGGPRRERLLPRDFAGLASAQDFSTSSAGLAAETTFDWGALKAEWSTGDRINLVPPEGELPAQAKFTDASVSAGIRFSQNLTNENTLLYTQLDDNESDAAVFDQLIARSKWSYFFTPAWSLRTIAQYVRTQTNPERTRLADGESFNLDLLLAWQPTAYRALYLGANTDFANEGTLTGREGGFDRFQRRSAGVYLKFSWSFGF